MIDDFIKSVLQINGDTPINNNSDNPALYPRELYIRRDGRLLIGDPWSSEQDVPEQSYGTIVVDKSLLSNGIQYEASVSTKNYKLNTVLTSTDIVPSIQGFWVKNLVCSAAEGTVALTVGDGTNPNRLDVLDGGALRVFLGSLGRVEGGTIKNSRLVDTFVNLKESVQYGTTLPTNLTNYRPGDIFILI